MSLSAHHLGSVFLAGALLLSEAGCHALRNLSSGIADCMPASAQPELPEPQGVEDYQFDRPLAPPATLPEDVPASPLRTDSSADASQPAEGEPAKIGPHLAALDAGVVAARLEARGAQIARDVDLSVITIDLSNADIADADLEHLRLFNKLQELNLAGTRISNAALDHLSQLRALEFLGLTGTEIDDDGLPAIARLAKLRFLSLAGTDVTDEGLQTLAGMRNLEAINLRSTRVTRRGVAALQSRLPGCRIVVDTEADGKSSSLPDAPATPTEPSPRIGRRLYPIPNRDVAEQQLELVLRRKLCDPEVLHALAALRAAEGNWEEARASIRCALEQRPDDGGLRFDYAVTLAHSGDLEAAFRQFERAVGHAAAHHNLGVLLVDQGQFAAGRREFEEALAADPAMESARDWLAYLDGERTQPPDGGPGLLSTAELHNLFGDILGEASRTREEQRRQPPPVDPRMSEPLFQPTSPFETDSTWFAPLRLISARG